MTTAYKINGAEIAKLKENGIRILTDDDVIIRGNYAVPKILSPGDTFIGDVVEYLHGCPLSKGTVEQHHIAAYVGKVRYLRVEGSVFVTDPDTRAPLRRYYVEQSPGGGEPQQIEVKHYLSDALSGCVSDRNDIRSQYIQLPDGDFIFNPKIKDIPKDRRRGLMMARYNELTRAGCLAPTHWRESFYQWLRTGSRPSRIANPIIEMRGASIAAHKVAELRGYLAEFGQLVRDAAIGDNDDYERAREILTSVFGYFNVALGRRMLDAWNAVSSDEFTHCGCGHVELNDSVHEVRHGRTVCDSCFEDDYVFCEDTDDYRSRDECYYHEEMDAWYSYPEHDEDDCDEDEHPSVRSYNTNVLRILSADPDIKCSSHGEFLMGIELEVVARSGYYREAVDKVSADLCKGYAILKNDGSLDEGGFEIVTAPRGLVEHIQRFAAWEPHPKLRSWDPGCCGMHVHISSKAFNSTTLGKFIEFINSVENDAFIKRIAGRHPSSDNQCQQYCARDGVPVKSNPKAVLDRKSVNRYRMVNTSNLTADESERLFGSTRHAEGRGYDTIELRVFRGTLNKARLLAQIEFAHAAVMFCRVASFRGLAEADFLKWLRPAAGLYPHLAKWLGVRANRAEVEANPKVRELAEV